MSRLTIAENIARFRHDKKVSQEQVADFIGVTKASVSKWETAQTTPDIMNLPQLAVFFDCTLDELMGYEPQLSKEQIQKLYQEFAAEFANGSFEEVMEKTRTYVKRYYSCYPFLFQICVLWLNHSVLAGDREAGAEILVSITDLCDHIKNHCKDVGICNDAIGIKTITQLQLGQAQEVVDLLEETLNPSRLFKRSEGILTQAYLMLGDTYKAESLIQISMYKDVLSLVANATLYLHTCIDDLKVCEDTIARIESILNAYELTRLHPNTSGVFEYQAAICYMTHGEKKKALMHMDHYVSCMKELFLTDEISIHGDDYFTLIEEWINAPDVEAYAPRDRKLVLEDAKKALENPIFAGVEMEPEYKRIKNRLGGIK